jgi:hypothetical protein
MIGQRLTLAALLSGLGMGMATVVSLVPAVAKLMRMLAE